MTETEKITDWPAELERLAKAKESEALAKADDIFAQCAAEHERQTAGYSFECRRFGDFLTVFIERAANGVDWRSEEPETKVSTSLNIGKTKEVRLVEGHCFDRRGALEYGYSMPQDDGRGETIGATGFGRFAPSKGSHYEVSPDYPYVPKTRGLVTVEKPEEKDRYSGMRFCDDSYQIRHKTDFPRPAKDDKIRFEGIGATIYAPAGKGRAVYDAIMNEIALNAPTPVLPSDSGGRRNGEKP